MTVDVQKFSRPKRRMLALYCAACLALAAPSLWPQPGPLLSYSFPIQAGSLSASAYTPFAMSYYPYHNGIQMDSVKYILTDQLVEGTTTTADRVVDVTAGGFAYRATGGIWSGSMSLVRNRRAYVILNRHEARDITLTGYPADSVTYISPMPNGAYRTAAPRMLENHPIDSVGLVTYGFHKSQSMREEGSDLVIDMVTRAIARCDSSGFLGTMDSLRIGNPVIIQTNHHATFDWTYYPGRP